VKTIAKINCVILIGVLAAHTQCAIQILEADLSGKTIELPGMSSGTDSTTPENTDGSRHNDKECRETQVSGRKSRIASNVFLQRSSLIDHQVTCCSKWTVSAIASFNGDAFDPCPLPSHALVLRI